MSRVYNFSAGPSMLPEAVLSRAASEMLDYSGSGQSVMEMSHRSSVFQSIIDRCEALLRELMGIPEDYAVLFLQGGHIVLQGEANAIRKGEGKTIDQLFREVFRW